MFYRVQRQCNVRLNLNKSNQKTFLCGNYTTPNVTSTPNPEKRIILPEEYSKNYEEWKMGLLDRKNKNFKIRGSACSSLYTHFISGHIMMDPLDKGFVMEEGFVVVSMNDYLEEYNPNFTDTKSNIRTSVFSKLRLKLNTIRRYFRKKVFKRNRRNKSPTYARFNSDLYENLAL